MGGMLSPSRNPKGLSNSILSKTTLVIAVTGSERNIPATPQMAPPINTTTIEIKALILTFDATISGLIKLLSIS